MPMSSDKWKFQNSWDSEGKISFRDKRMVLMNPEVAVGAKQDLRDSTGILAKKIFFKRAYDAGRNLAHELPENKGKKRSVEIAAELMSHMGYGKVKLYQFDESGRVIFRAGNSFEGEYQRNKETYKDEPICDILRGMASGAASIILKDNIQAKETMCIGEGDELCEVVLNTGGVEGDNWLD